MPFETLNLSDGTTMMMQRPADTTEAQWTEMKDYYETHPVEAHEWESLGKNADLQRDEQIIGFMQQYYDSKRASDDQETLKQMEDLYNDKDFKNVFTEIEQNWNAAAKFATTDQLMIKMSKKMGGVPPALKQHLKYLNSTPMTLHEACKMGSMKSVDDFLDDPAIQDHPDGINEKDHKGIAPIAYAIGTNRIDVVKKLVEKKADIQSCDTDGNSGAHYAAGYGRKEILDILVKAGCDKKKKNNSGKTPADWAAKNNQKAP